MLYKIQFFRTRDDDFELLNLTRKEISVPQSEDSRKVCAVIRKRKTNEAERTQEVYIFLKT